MNLAATLRGTTYRFRDLKEVLAKANEEKSGDRLAGLAAEQRLGAGRGQARAGRGDAAASCTRTRSCRPSSDAVTRLILDDLQRPDLRQREVVDGGEAARARAVRRRRDGRGAAAPVARADQRDDRRLRQADVEPRPRVRGAEDPRRRARQQHARPARAGCRSRLQPNHPSDSIEGILASLREGLSFGAGDAVIGINPVTDDPEHDARRS